MTLRAPRGWFTLLADVRSADALSTHPHKIDIPPAARAFFGNSAGYTEVGRFDPLTRRYHLNAIPAFGADRIKLTSEIWADSVGPGRIERHVIGEAIVNIFGLSKLIEGVTRQQTRDQYGQAAEFMNRWVHKKGG